MKIVMPVDDRSIETNISQHFGRAPYFLIYDTASTESIFLDSSAAASQGGAGIKAAQTIVDNKVGALLTPRCGENAAEVFNKANIKLYKTINDSQNGERHFWDVGYRGKKSNEVSCCKY